jgi:hypothetical protein
MADINTQTKQVLNKNEITNPTKIFSEENQAKEVVKEPLSLEERTQMAIDQGVYSPDLRNKFIGEINAIMFGDPYGGLKYEKGTEDDKQKEMERFKGMNLDQIYDEYQYWNSELQKVTDLEENDMNVRDWFSKMFKKFGVKEEPKGKETELLKGSNYYPPEP